MTQTDIIQPYGDQTLTHVLVSDGSGEPRPGVLMFPTVMGVSPLEIGFAEKLVALGYSVLVADLFGRRFQPGADREAAFAAMGALRADRAALRDRLLAVLDTARAQDAIDANRIAATGYCFGGQCALDLARSGVGIAGVASFHGLFDPPGLPANPINAKVVAYHGWDDPMVPPDAVVALGKELTEAGADWQIHAYGHVGHGFTNPYAASMGIAGVAFNEAANRRSWAALEDYLAELFG
ncbi:dienelactone hydrolase family protein [Sphingomonas jaspsi]|uniref:dienelactone hydrolase family protein n=1 Tax=Sphingomonas jaspsi TaxID=392409 RepID=UPI0004BCB303|nr:dienelactone hydrolase family protein [Sphingomonas jaspsi]